MALPPQLESLVAPLDVRKPRWRTSYSPCEQYDDAGQGLGVHRPCAELHTLRRSRPEAGRGIRPIHSPVQLRRRPCIRADELCGAAHTRSMRYTCAMHVSHVLACRLVMDGLVAPAQVHLLCEPDVQSVPWPYLQSPFDMETRSYTQHFASQFERAWYRHRSCTRCWAAPPDTPTGTVVRRSNASSGASSHAKAGGKALQLTSTRALNGYLRTEVAENEGCN